MGAAYDDQKRAAVLAALLAGQSVHQIAKDYSVSRRSVQLWRDAAGIRQGVSPEKQDEVGELVANVLTTVLVTLQIQAEQFRNEDWLQKQSAEGAAVLFGVLTDKAVRILEALESAQPNDPEVDTPATPEAA